MKVFLTLICLLLMGAQAWAQMSYIPKTQSLKKKGYQLGILGESFVSSKLVDKSGSKSSFPEGTSFSRLQGELSGLYGATSSLQLGAGIRYRRNHAQQQNTSGDEVSVTGSGVQSLLVSGLYTFEEINKIQYALEGLFRYSTYKNETFATGSNPTTLALGDEGNEYSLGLAATYLFKNNKFLTLRGGYRDPGSNISEELYWQLEGAMAWRQLALIAGVDGVKTMDRDPYKSNPQGKPVYNTGTNLYNGVNREWTAPYAGINFAFNKTWRVEFRGSQVISGASTDLGTNLSIALIHRVDPTASKFVDSKFKDYDIESTILKVSPQKGYVVIDKGVASEVEKGMRFDFYDFDYVGGNVLVASGVVVKTKTETAIVKMTNTFNATKELKPGLIGRASLK